MEVNKKNLIRDFRRQRSHDSELAGSGDAGSAWRREGK